MSGEKDLEQLEKEAAAKAKAAAQAKLKAQQTSSSSASGDSDAKSKAAAAAKAKAAAQAKLKAQQTSSSSASGDSDAKSKAAAAAKAKASAVGADDEKAKALAIAKAKAAAAAKAKKKENIKQTDDAPELPPSPNQAYLNKYVKVITEHLGEDVLEDYYINRLSKDVPTLVATEDAYFKIAEFLKYNEQLAFDYLSGLHGSDFETHMEVYAHLFSYKNRQSVALKVKIDRNDPQIASLQPLWAGANWPECEAYDLLGIKFIGHPNLHRIMLGKDWVGHPLRKDYVPYDVEV